MGELRHLSLPSDIFGPFGPFKISYVQHQGQFVGKTSSGPFNVPFQITTPVDPAQADGVCIFEPLHRFSGAVGRDSVFGHSFLFAGGASHATVGHRREGRPDLEILSEFADALRGSPDFIKRVERIYAIGFSDSGDAVQAAYQPFGHRVFDLTIACTANYALPVKLNGQKPIIVFGTENEFVFQLIDHVAQNASFPQYRWYTVPGAPHIPDTALTRANYPDPPVQAAPGAPQPVSVAGTTPINWVPFLKALLVAGHEWVNGTPPPLAALPLQRVR